MSSEKFGIEPWRITDRRKLGSGFAQPLRQRDPVFVCIDSGKRTHSGRHVELSQSRSFILSDERGDDLQSCSIQFQNLGGRARFSGPIRTVRCHRDNGLVKQLLNSPGEGAVLVVDGGGSLESALMGDLIATAAVENGWSGVIINGVIRDRVVVRTLELGTKALGSNPRKSAKDGAGEVDVPVEFGGVTFVPGRMVWSDDDGILAER